jgi:hypothetical protein
LNNGGNRAILSPFNAPVGAGIKYKDSKSVESESMEEYMSGVAIGNERAAVWDEKELTGVQSGIYDVNL